ncbi:MAG: aminotransferase class IV [Planctomycetes bacterium]|nr:aminotransferase class IV [Planctomycetota bacterium]
MPTIVNLDGQIVPPEGARISVFDHGFLFGDSVYEVIRTYRGIPFTCREHLARLERSAAGIGLTLPLSRAGFVGRIVETLRAAAVPEAYIRVVVTRGVGEIDIDPATCPRPSVLVLAKELRTHAPECYSKGVAAALCGIERTSRRATDPGIKSGNYLNSVLAIMEARRKGCYEGFMRNGEGHLTEGTTSNLFFVSGGRLHTPAPECGILLGITRAVVLDLADAAGTSCQEGFFTSDELLAADEAFLTSTTRGVMPIATIEGRRLRAPAPGPVTRQLMERFAAHLEEATTVRDLGEYLEIETGRK